MEQIKADWAAFRGVPQELELPSAPKQFLHYFEAVSYTHLDVYKRQGWYRESNSYTSSHLHGFGTSFAESGGFYVRSGDAPRVPACAAGAAAAVRPGNFQKTCQGRRFCGEIEN